MKNFTYITYFVLILMSCNKRQYGNFNNSATMQRSVSVPVSRPSFEPSEPLSVLILTTVRVSIQSCIKKKSKKNYSSNLILSKDTSDKILQLKVDTNSTKETVLLPTKNKSEKKLKFKEIIAFFYFKKIPRSSNFKIDSLKTNLPLSRGEKYAKLSFKISIWAIVLPITFYIFSLILSSLFILIPIVISVIPYIFSIIGFILAIHFGSLALKENLNQEYKAIAKMGKRVGQIGLIYIVLYILFIIFLISLFRNIEIKLPL